MKIFISWSGKRVQHVAEALREWLLFVVDGIEPWSPFTYGETWHLVDLADGRILEKAALRDTRLLRHLGIGPDSTLRLELLSGSLVGNITSK